MLCSSLIASDVSSAFEYLLSNSEDMSHGYSRQKTWFLTFFFFPHFLISRIRTAEEAYTIAYATTAIHLLGVYGLLSGLERLSCCFVRSPPQRSSFNLIFFPSLSRSRQSYPSGTLNNCSMQISLIFSPSLAPASQKMVNHVLQQRMPAIPFLGIAVWSSEHLIKWTASREPLHSLSDIAAPRK
jgi:hypothetical protein